jgi:hypothetical protein
MNDENSQKENIGKWGNTSSSAVFCEHPDPHNDGETQVWEMRCKDCNHVFLGCSECVTEGDCSCPDCRGFAEITEAQAAKIEKDLGQGAWEHKFGKPGLN